MLPLRHQALIAAGHFCALTCLSLKDLEFPQLRDFSRLICSFPSLHRLYLLNVTWRRGTDCCMETEPFAKYLHLSELEIKTRDLAHHRHWVSKLILQRKMPDYAAPTYEYFFGDPRVICVYHASAPSSTDSTDSDLGFAPSLDTWYINVVNLLPVPLELFAWKIIDDLIYGSGATSRSQAVVELRIPSRHRRGPWQDPQQFIWLLPELHRSEILTLVPEQLCEDENGEEEENNADVRANTLD
ncbi:hypothetical protein CERSUDRAFT_78427 [Gelatoporia subvermispora B]|uniref:F-box domain-containing protein n=1 Tax=Ceriporiopsis subvermispora (strain B) TaxID=914234 RepID=M2QGD0_CERS8|nr:hypothetical protein CERSUDRAFT_78427 [Gelatoporia subvermispora B]